MFEGKSFDLSRFFKGILIAGGIFAGLCGGAGYGIRYYFNERANVREKQSQIDQLKARETNFIHMLTPAEQKAYQALKDSANQRHIMQISNNTPKPF